MGELSCFLKQNQTPVEHVKYVATKRFVGKDKKPVEWELRCITTEEDEALKKACTMRVPVPGRKGMTIPEMDYTSYVGKLAAACTVYPNLNDKELQDSYGVMGSDKLLKQLLELPGEYNNYLAKVQNINGFDTSMEELVEEAKN